MTRACFTARLCHFLCIKAAFRTGGLKTDGICDIIRKKKFKRFCWTFIRRAFDKYTEVCMKVKNLTLIAASAVFALVLSSCGAVSDKPEGITSADFFDTLPESTASAAASEETTTAEPEISLPVYAEADIGETVYEPTEYYKLCEAEDGKMSGYCAAMSSRDGHSGGGYVTGASLPDSELILTFDVDSSQHYSVTVCAAADSPVEGILYVDGLARGKIRFSGSGKFESVKFENIYLTRGEAAVSIKELSGECDIDFVLVESSSAVYGHDYSVSGALSLGGSSEKTVKLYKYLCEIYGEAVLSGQQCAQGSDKEIEAVARLTGRYPAIRFGELMGYACGEDTGDIELAVNYAENGGLVGYSWYWMMNGSCYLDKSGFNLNNAVTDHDAAHLSLEKLIEIAESGGVSKECLQLVEGIDLVAEQLKRLKELDIPVIFRPLPEAGNGEFWWGSDKESYLWLYELIYTRFIEYHKLNNLIWVWNAQNTEWYVGDGLCDIISLDIYDFSRGMWDNQSHINPMLRLYNLSADKPAAVSECNVLPGPANIAKDMAYWLYASVWSDGYAVGGDGAVSHEYMSEAEWIMFYNCSEVITRDKLVSLK